MTPYGILAAISIALLGLAYITLIVAGFRAGSSSVIGITFLNPFSIIPFILSQWSKTKYSVFLLLGAVFFFLAAVGAQQMVQTDRILGGEECGFELTMPKGWNERKALRKGALIQMSRPVSELYFVAFATDAKNSESTNSDGIANEAVKEIADKLGVPAVDACKQIDLDGSDACSYTIEGCLEDLCLAYTITTIADTNRFVHLVGWTTLEREEKNMPALTAIRDSFTWRKKNENG